MKPQHKVIAGVAAVAVVLLFVWLLSRGSRYPSGGYGYPTPTPMAALPIAPVAVTLAPSLSISPTLMPELVGYAGPGDDDYGPVN